MVVRADYRDLLVLAMNPHTVSIRDMLFGDRPLAAWPSDTSNIDPRQPWALFVNARNSMSAGDQASAVAAWQRVLSTPDLESRHYLQAWYFLRSVGYEPPPSECKVLLGIVVEVAMPEGTDLLAAYADHTARYYNFSGSGVVWDGPDTSLDVVIDHLLDAGRNVVTMIGPWEGERLPPPPHGELRLSFLTPSGLHFGQGAIDTMAADPLAGPVFHNAAVLMQQLIQKAESNTR